MAEKQVLSAELRFRIFDSTDLAHSTYPSTTTIVSLKEKLLTEWPRDRSVIPKSVSDIKLIHSGKVLDSEKTLADTKITFGNSPGVVFTMHVVVQPVVLKRKKKKKKKTDKNKAGDTQYSTSCTCTIL